MVEIRPRRTHLTVPPGCYVDIFEPGRTAFLLPGDVVQIDDMSASFGRWWVENARDGRIITLSAEGASSRSSHRAGSSRDLGRGMERLDQRRNDDMVRSSLPAPQRGKDH